MPDVNLNTNELCALRDYFVDGGVVGEEAERALHSAVEKISMTLEAGGSHNTPGSEADIIARERANEYFGEKGWRSLGFPPEGPMPETLGDALFGARGQVTYAHGRAIELHIGEEVDQYGQFLVRLDVAGKERYSGRFTDKSEEAEAGVYLEPVDLDGKEPLFYSILDHPGHPAGTPVNGVEWITRDVQFALFCLTCGERIDGDRDAHEHDGKTRFEWRRIA